MNTIMQPSLRPSIKEKSISGVNDETDDHRRVWVILIYTGVD